MVAVVDQEAENGLEVRPVDRKLDVGHHDAPDDIPPEPEFNRKFATLKLEWMYRW